MYFTLNGKGNWRMVSKKEGHNVFKFRHAEMSKTYKPSRRTTHYTESQLPKNTTVVFAISYSSYV